MSLDVPGVICQEIIAHCRACLPNEGCGILAGRGDRASVFYPMRNAEQSPSSFRMDPDEQFQVMRSMRAGGLKMLGICHSHPDGPAYPSEQDIRLAFYEDVAQMIVSFADPQPAVAAFRIAAGVVTTLVLTHS